MVFFVVVMKRAMSASVSNWRKPTRLLSSPELQVIAATSPGPGS